MTQRLDPSQLPGEHRSRVFVGGSYAPPMRPLLDDLSEAVRAQGLHPIIADRYHLPVPERDVHDLTLYLLHSCRLAVFELSLPSGAYMEVERCLDYGVRALVLRQQAALPLSRMVSSLAAEHKDRIRLFHYERPAQAVDDTMRWLTAMRSVVYADIE